MRKRMMLTVLLGLGSAVWGGRATASETASAAKPSPDAVFKILAEGNARFVSGKAGRPHADAARLALAGTADQADYALATILSCSDSRVPVELIFDAGVMDLFVIRVAGNVADTDEIGSVEYGLTHVKTPVLMVLGHTKCGAVTAVTHSLQGKGHPMERNIPPLVDNIIPAAKRALAGGEAGLIDAAIEENVWQSVEDLFMKSAAVRTMAEEGKVKVVGAIYDIGTGKIAFLPADRAASLLKKAEAAPNRATEIFAAE